MKPEAALGRLINLREQLTDDEFAEGMPMYTQEHFCAIIDDLDDIIRSIEREVNRIRIYPEDCERCGGSHKTGHVLACPYAELPDSKQPDGRSKSSAPHDCRDHEDAVGNCKICNPTEWYSEPADSEDMEPRLTRAAKRAKALGFDPDGNYDDLEDEEARK
jgi:predicted Zn-ribbon and HTH transcriptional regulator